MVSAHLHCEEKRVTLLYHGLGALTFEFKEAKSLLHMSLWSCKYKESKFNCQLKFNKFNPNGN